MCIVCISLPYIYRQIDLEEICSRIKQTDVNSMVWKRCRCERYVAAFWLEECIRGK